MVMDLSKEVELDLSVFHSDFDPHRRGKQCIRMLEGIQANRYEDRRRSRANNRYVGKRLCTFNQQKLLDYAAYLIRRIKRNEFSVASFEKNIAECWKFCLHLEDQKVSELSEGDVKKWWERELTRYEDGAISHESLHKPYVCCQAFMKRMEGINSTEKHPHFKRLEVPKKPKPKLIDQLPSQEEVKKLIEEVYTDGKQYTIRDQAILALANDTGARISEILSIRNKHIKPEKNYLVVSFPESKTAPRTVISYLAKPFLESWAKVSPNKDKGNDTFFFCRKDGGAITYRAIKKSFDRALEKVGISWAPGKGIHFFRSLFSSRAFEWGYAQKHYWLGWAYKDNESRYSHLSYKSCVDVYFKMLREERNPFLGKKIPFWETEEIDEAIIEQLMEKDEFRMMIRKMVRESKSN